MLAPAGVVILALVGCVGNGGPAVPGGADDFDLPGVLNPPAGGPQLPKHVSADFEWSDFPPVRDGAGFDTALGANRVTAGAVTAEFAPLPATTQPALADTAYAVYALRCYREATTTELVLSWRGTPPAAGTCWIGLPDWTAGAWRWEQLPPDNRLSQDPLALATADHRTYVAVVLTGGAAATLDSIACVCEPDGTQPFNFYAPMWWPATYLIDMEGNVVREWPADFRVNSTACLLPNGDVLRTNANGFGAQHPKFEWLDWEGNMLWTWDGYPADFLPHHDIAPMPNGNVMMLGAQLVSREEAIAAGRIEAFVPEDGLQMEMLIEVKPTGPTTGEIVWQWRQMDHIVQDVDESRLNYGQVDGNVRLLDFNYTTENLEDYLHANAVAYNAELDQLVISYRATCEIMVIDHGTTTEEAAGHTGGRQGFGGDFLYRWGNPQMYRTGTPEDQRLFYQHDPEWIPRGCPGAGNILVFNNNCPETEPQQYSSIVEIVPPVTPEGAYEMESLIFGPAEPVWRYVADPPESFYAVFISGAQRLPDGNTLICSGPQGRFFEVTPEGETVWEYVNTRPQIQNQVFRVERFYLFEPWIALTE